MNTLDRGVVYIGVWLGVILAAIGVCSIKEIKSKILEREIKQDIRQEIKALLGKDLAAAAYDSPPIYISSSAGNCIADKGAYYANPVAGTTLSWHSRDNAYKVLFSTSQNLSNPGTAISIDVPAGGDSAPIAITQAAITACNNTTQCIFTYTITGCTMGQVGSLGIIVRP